MYIIDETSTFDVSYVFDIIICTCFVYACLYMIYLFHIHVLYMIYMLHHMYIRDKTFTFDTSYVYSIHVLYMIYMVPHMYIRDQTCTFETPTFDTSSTFDTSRVQVSFNECDVFNVYDVF